MGQQRFLPTHGWPSQRVGIVGALFVCLSVCLSVVCQAVLRAFRGKGGR